MTANSTFYLLPSKKFYLPFEFYKFNKDYLNIIEEILDKKTWFIMTDRIYISCAPKDYKFLEYGWKIHISGTIWDSENILKEVSKICYEHEVAFKCLMDKEIFDASQNKAAPRGSSGKFITIYPESEKHFKFLISILYDKLKDYNGPYILTDRRYGEKGIVYYRYGSISVSSVVIDDKDVQILKTKDGKVFIDDRKPVFQLPSWVKDPFRSEEKKPNKELLLNNKYKINKVLRFSNAGGTYLAYDLLNNNRLVIIKEARPYTVQHGKYKDALDLKETEYAILNKIKTLNVSPNPIDFFKEWEHAYLVESYIEGKTIKEFVAAENPFVTPNASLEDFNQYYKKIIRIISQLLKSIGKLHDSNIIVGDISPDNIVITDSLEPIFIDFDSSTDLDSNIEKYSFSTIGFSSQIENPEDFRRDYVSLGFLIFYLLTPSSNIVELRKDFYDPCLRYLEDKYSLPKEFRKLITLLNNTNEKTNVNEFISVVIDIQPNLKFSKNIQLENDIDNKINKIGKFILKNTLNGENQFFPSDFMAREFLSITHGTAGVLRALDYCKIDYDIELSRKYNHIINENHNNIQINLNTGLAGICWYYLEQNATEQSRRLLNIISERQNTVTKLDLGNGLSGIGMLYLKTYLMIGERDYLYKAIDIGESILNSTEINSIKKVGISNGRSGISLFLLYLSVITNSGKYAKFGKKILLEEIEYGHEINYGYGFPSSVDKPNFLYPYFSEGTAGVAAVAIRYYHLFNDSILKEEVVKLGNGLNCVLATELGLYSGLTGIANTLLDYYQFTNDRKYYNKTCEIINNIQQFLLKDDGEGLGFPGSLMYRFSCDYSTGASGFIMLLERIKSNKNNFHFFLDELFINTNSPIKLEKVISQT